MLTYGISPVLIAPVMLIIMYSAIAQGLCTKARESLIPINFVRVKWHSFSQTIDQSVTDNDIISHYQVMDSIQHAGVTLYSQSRSTVALRSLRIQQLNYVNTQKTFIFVFAYALLFFWRTLYSMEYSIKL